MSAPLDATLSISRQSAGDIKMRSIEVLVDDQFVGQLMYGERLDLPVKAGTHTLKVTNRLKSKSTEFSIQPGQQVEFRTSAVLLGGMWLLISMMGTVAYKVTLERAA